MARANDDDLVSALNELTAAVRKTTFDVFLHYSNEDGGWQVKLGNAINDERWTDAGTPKPLVGAVRGHSPRRPARPRGNPSIAG